MCVCGLLVGSASPNTVSRDELTAFVELMRRTHGPLRVVVGAKFVVQGWKQLSFGSVRWHCHGDLWVAALQHETRDIQLYEIKSHLQLEVFLAVDPAAEWVWHANIVLLCSVIKKLARLTCKLTLTPCLGLLGAHGVSMNGCSPGYVCGSLGSGTLLRSQVPLRLEPPVLLVVCCLLKPKLIARLAMNG